MVVVEALDAEGLVSALDRLRLRLETGFALDPNGRLVGVNSPESVAPPRFVLSGCATGNLATASAAVTDVAAAELITLASDEPPFCHPDSPPRHLDRYLEILAAKAAELELNHGIRPGLRPAEGVRLVGSGTAEGEALLEALRRGGMPAGLFDMGFVDIGEFWPPWCAALVDGEVASLAFTARLSPAGAAVGVATSPSFRRRGLAAATVAGWSRLPELHGRALFYSVRVSNGASRGVVARLGLERLGMTLIIT